MYAIGEYHLISEPNDASQGLGAFAQAAYAPPDRNGVAHYYGAGLAYTGLFPHREHDILSLGCAYARLSSGVRATEDLLTAETAIEATYLMQLEPYLAVQPDIQFVHDPSGNPNLQDAWVVAIRIVVDL